LLLKVARRPMRSIKATTTEFQLEGLWVEEISTVAILHFCLSLLVTRCTNQQECSHSWFPFSLSHDNIATEIRQ
jgi:hypothetical protein